MKILDLVGKKIHMLTVLSEAPRRKRRSRFRCQCECGNFTEVDGSKLNTKCVHSCGCFIGKQFKPGNRKGLGESVRNKVIASYKENAKRKGLEYSLTNEKTISFLSGACFYCGREPYHTLTIPHSYGSFTYNGIDRLNNFGGYTFGNCVSCCKECNYLKNKFSYEEFMTIIKRIYENRIQTPA